MPVGAVRGGGKINAAAAQCPIRYHNNRSGQALHLYAAANFGK